MRAHNISLGRSVARLGLESLESRTLLSATLLPAATPTSASALVQQSSGIQIQSLAITNTANYSYSWSVGPSAVLTGTNSTGSVAIALSPAGSSSAPVGGVAAAISLARLSTSSSASDAHPDVYNTTFTLSLKIKDSSSGATGTLAFKATLHGTLSYDRSSLLVTFQNPMQKLTLGGHVYTVTLPSSAINLAFPGNTPVKISASVQVSGIPTTPPPITSGTPVTYTHQFKILPGPLVTGTNSSTINGKSTGSVTLSLYRSGSSTAKRGGPAVVLPLAVVTSSSSASSTKPDLYNTTNSVSLVLKDSASGISKTLTFKGTITGKLTAFNSTLKLSFQGPLTQQIKLGSHTYTVTLSAGTFNVGAPGTTPVFISAIVKVS
jgi:hypothetical protein